MTHQLGLFGDAPPPSSAGPRASLYLALLPNLALRQQIQSIVKPLLRELGLGGRTVQAERWHSTLFALGDGGVPPPALIQSARTLAASMQAAAFSIEFDRLRYYRQSGALVLANDDKDSAAAKFSARLFHLFKSAGLRPYGRGAEHITLLYKDSGEAAADLMLPEALRWQVDAFALVHSSTEHYRPLDSWPLG